MRKLAIALGVTAAVLLAGSLSWKADATTFRRDRNLPSAAKNYSPVEKAGCSAWEDAASAGIGLRPIRCWCALLD